MTDDNKRELFRVVLAAMGTKRGGRRRVFDAIADAHLGRPDGYVVNSDNMSLFRQYRNAVSPRPAHLIDAALAWKEAQDAVPTL